MRQGQDGFTLVEILVAMAIFAISSMAVTSLLVNHAKLVSLNSQTAEAITFAQDELEDLRTSDFSSLAPSGTKSKTSPKGITYTTSWTVQANTPTTGMSTLTVTVTWSHKGVTKSYVAKSIFSSVSPS